MKLRSTTPASNTSFVTKAIVVSAVVLLAVTTPVQIFSSTSVSADQYDAQIEAIKQKVAGYQEEANALRGKAASLQNTLAQLAADKAGIQAEIDLYQAQYDKLVQEIKDTQSRIDDNKKTSGELIVRSSMSDDVPLIVRLAASNNLADYVEGEASRTSVRDSIVKKTEETEKLKKQLVEKQAETKKVLDQQKESRAILANKEAEQQRLLTETNNDEAAYQRLTEQGNSEMQRLQEQQRIINTPPGGGSLPGPSGGTGNYPYIGGWSGDFSPLVDPWGFYYQQCVSYVAWKIHDSGRSMPRWGSMYQPAHAKYWPNFTSNKGSTPREGAAAVTTAGPYGHVMYVEKVYGNGMIRVSDYNLGFDGAYRTYDRSASGIIYLYF